MTDTQLSEAQDRIEKFTEENHSLQKKSAELKGENKRDAAFKIRERQTENEVVAILRTEALEQFPAPKKAGIFAKLFHSAQVEVASALANGAQVQLIYLFKLYKVIKATFFVHLASNIDTAAFGLVGRI